MTLLYALTALLSACSLLYELLIAQSLSVLSANTVTRYSVTIGLYLGAMGLGAAMARRMFEKRNPWSALWKVEIVLSVLGAGCVLIVHAAHVLFTYCILQGWLSAGVGVFFGISACVILAVGFFSGLELPLLIRIGNENSRASVVHKVLAADYFGSLAAGLVFPLVLLPRLDLIGIGFLIALVNIAAALIVLRTSPAGGRKLPRCIATAACACVLLAGLARQDSLQQYFLKRYYYYYEYFARLNNFTLLNYLKARLGLPTVERYGSLYQKIDVVKLVSYGDPFTPAIIDAYSAKFRRDPAFPRKYALFLNGDYQFWTDFEEIYHEYFAHVPVITNGAVPERVLVLGAGDGLLVRELLKYSRVREITMVELDEKMISLARNHPVFSYANSRSLDDARVRVEIADAYFFVRDSEKTFDAVYVDFPDPKDFDLSKLYSSEFYQFLRHRISPGGYAVINAPGIGQFTQDDNGVYRMDRENSWEIFRSTLLEAGFEGIVPYASVLETDNARAIQILHSLLERVGSFEFTSTDPEHAETLSLTAKDDMIKQILEVYTNDLIAAFIMVTPQERAGHPVYTDPDVALYVLNEMRFGLAFSLPFTSGNKVDKKKVNSIIRPRLPNTPFWWIRTPI